MKCEFCGSNKGRYWGINFQVCICRDCLKKSGEIVKKQDHKVLYFEGMVYIDAVLISKKSWYAYDYWIYEDVEFKYSFIDASGIEEGDTVVVGPDGEGGWKTVTSAWHKPPRRLAQDEVYVYEGCLGRSLNRKWLLIDSYGKHLRAEGMIAVFPGIYKVRYISSGGRIYKTAKNNTTMVLKSVE